MPSRRTGLIDRLHIHTRDVAAAKRFYKAVMAALEPGYVTRGRPDQALRGLAPLFAPAPAKWGFEAQAEVKPSFKTPTPRFETIPFLPNFPRLDQDLSAWGRVRPRG